MGALSVKEWAKPIIKGLQEPAKRKMKSRKKGGEKPAKGRKKGQNRENYEKIMI